MPVFIRKDGKGWIQWQGSCGASQRSQESGKHNQNIFYKKIYFKSKKEKRPHIVLMMRTMCLLFCCSVERPWGLDYDR